MNHIMKRIFLSYIVLAISFCSFNTFSQNEEQDLLGLPGDNLSLYAVLDLFQQSKTIEDFEKSLNAESTGVNNLDFNNDSKVDFIKVDTEQDGDDFMFILRVDISEKEAQDVAVILVSKDENKKITLQIVGDEHLYGKDYIVEPRTESTSVTANPAYAGEQPVTENVPATKVVVVESAPIVQYVYSPAYIPYYPPYYYGYYPPYFVPFTIMAIGIYHHNHYYHHYGYHNTVVIHNHNHYNNYNINSRRNSVYVNNNISRGNYNTSGRASTLPSTANRPTKATRPSTTNRPTTATRPSTTNRPTTATRPSTTNRPTSTRPSTSNYNTGSRTRSNYSSPSRPSSMRSTSSMRSPSMSSRSRRGN